MNTYVQEAVARLRGVSKKSFFEFRDALTAELCAITQSELSYVAAVNLAEDTLTMIGWSQSAMQFCATSDKPIVYQLNETGLWGDAVRERKPVITNDYQGLKKPTKKGYPKGHVPVYRHMNLPIFEDGKVAMVVGVGNKADEYTLEDVENVEALMGEVWQSFRKALWEATW